MQHLLRCAEQEVFEMINGHKYRAKKDFILNQHQGQNSQCASHVQLEHSAVQIE